MELQENTAKQVEVIKDETQKSLKELWENTNKQVMELIEEVNNGRKTHLKCGLYGLGSKENISIKI